jgi:5,10-methylenetetrahydromethanopterin reductase
MPVAAFDDAVTRLQTYLRGEAVDLDGFASRIHWLERSPAPKVPLDIAASGPKLLALAGRIAEQVTVAVGADPERVAWAFDLADKAAADHGDGRRLAHGAYVNVACHPDRDTGRGLIAGTVAAFAHFSAMPGSTGAGQADDDREIVAEVGRTYDSRQHLRNDAPQTKALDPAFVERFAVVGDPDRCVERLLELQRLGIERFVLTGPGLGADRDAASLANRLLVSDVLPALRTATEENHR